ncbi:MAG: hypothetical protein IKG86_09150 [Paludibacteraceae bacterium]|nr:hypothetical protein [Paludibacteraceae bacterium]
MMRTNTRYILLLLLLTTALTAGAQTRLYGDWGSSYKKQKSKTNQAGLYTDQYDGVHHLVGMQVEGAYASFLQQSQLMQFTPGGYALGLTLQYAYLNGPFFLQTGVGLRWQDVQNRVADQLYTIEAIDAAGAACHMDYSFHDRTDRMRELYAQVPFYLGGYFRGFYVMGGVKASLPLTGDTRFNLLTTTTARYDGYIGPIEEMDNHGIRRDVPLTPDQQRGEALQMRFDLLGVFECGYELAFSNKGRPGYHRSHMLDQRLRIGAFAEIGILNSAPKTKLALYTVPDTSPYDFQTFRYNHVLSTGQVSSVHSLYAGVRLTYFFFGVQTKEKCLLCGARGSISPW